MTERVVQQTECLIRTNVAALSWIGMENVVLTERINSTNVVKIQIFYPMVFVVQLEELKLVEFAVHPEKRPFQEPVVLLLDKVQMEFAVKWVVDLLVADVAWNLEFPEPSVVNLERMRLVNVAHLLKDLLAVRVVAMAETMKESVALLVKENQMESVVQLGKLKVMASAVQMEKSMLAVDVVKKLSFL